MIELVNLHDFRYEDGAPLMSHDPLGNCHVRTTCLAS